MFRWRRLAPFDAAQPLATATRLFTSFDLPYLRPAAAPQLTALNAGGAMCSNGDAVYPCGTTNTMFSYIVIEAAISSLPNW